MKAIDVRTPLLNRSSSRHLILIQVQAHLKGHVVGALLSDARFMMRDYQIPISKSALHVYRSASMSMPECSLQSRPPDVVSAKLVSQRDTRWQPNKLIMEGHTGEVNSTAFSPDGLRIVSSSYDETVRVWNAVSGRVRHILKGFNHSREDMHNFLARSLDTSHSMCISWFICCFHSRSNSHYV
jgi:WD40 repeat protein